ncbi:uncharacterized protein LOC113371277 [Ctenocephalides felis]|uniref:uncharacterized protein LOC113371277 n=1 Tax=Ctenocephalides felis TaxID=7515 RepID=UPI000E6E1BDB|nr:uncharacterized protein LOC113371277 [Ctenocephalides felis]
MHTVSQPETLSGVTRWFSLVSDKGDAVAAVHTTLMQLVRERVYKFVSTEPFAAYSETLAGRAQYIRGMARAGQVYRLLAVFQDGAGDSSNGNNKDGKGQYAQLLGDNQQIIYVSLSTKGKFYETSSSLPAPGKQSNFDKDCVHRLPNILQHCDLPVNVKLISGPLPDCMSQDSSDILTLQSVSSEPMLVTCSLTENPEGSELQYQLTKTTASPDVTVSRCIVGPDTEHRLYKSASAQNVLAFCQNNLDSWFRRIEVVDAPPVPENDKYENILNKIDGLKLLKSASFAKFLRGDNKHSPSHEKEDSIIFLSKHDLESMESDNMKKKHSSDYSLDKMSSEISSKMKVFEPSKRTKWFKHFRILNTSEQKDYRQEITEKYREFVDPFDPNDKSKSIERYQDMAKLIEERFGKKFSTQDKTPPVKNDSLKKVLTKSISVQTSCPDNSLDCAENDENKSIQPDVIPLEDLNKIEKYDEISDRTNSGPKTSFFTEKLCAEFHVKTKQLSKSTSSLNTILHFSVPQKMSVIELRKESQSNESITKATVHFPEHKTNEEEISNIQNRKLPEIDDLPYSTVRDRLDNKNQNQKIFEEEICPEDNENIYAEICGDTINFENGLFVNNNEIDAIILDTSIDADPINLNSGTTSSSSSAGKKIVSESSIKIKVGCDEGFVDTENITVIESDNCYMNVVESIEDTEAFYNTLK